MTLDWFACFRDNERERGGGIGMKDRMYVGLLDASDWAAKSSEKVEEHGFLGCEAL